MVPAEAYAQASCRCPLRSVRMPRGAGVAGAPGRQPALLSVLAAPGVLAGKRVPEPSNTLHAGSFWRGC